MGFPRGFGGLGTWGYSCLAFKFKGLGPKP